MIATIIAPHDMVNCNSKLSINGLLPELIIPLTIASTIPIATIPITIPSGIEISPNTAPSKKILFLICFAVAPTLAIIPNSLVFSVRDILKLFLITKAEVKTIMPITIAIMVKTKLSILSLLKIPM